jgi:hypothetical protein
VTDISSGKIEQNRFAPWILANLADDLDLSPSSRRCASNPADHSRCPQASLGQADQRAPDNDDHAAKPTRPMESKSRPLGATGLSSF